MKQKTVKSAEKRVKVTSTGKIMRRKMTAQHLSQGKSKRTRSASGKFVVISKNDSKNIKRLVPNR